jgi:hypothetical protein
MPQDLGYKSLKLKTDNIRARTRDVLTAVVWRDKRDVHILTNVHNLPVEGIFCNEHGNSIKPYIVEHYNWHMARGLCGHRGQNGKQLFNHLTHMEVYHGTIFPPPGSHGSEHLHSFSSISDETVSHRDFLKCLVRNLVAHIGNEHIHRSH